MRGFADACTEKTARLTALREEVPFGGLLGLLYQRETHGNGRGVRRDSRHVPPLSPEASPAAELRRLQAEQAAADWWQPGLGGLPEVHWQAQRAECIRPTGNAQVGALTPVDG